MPAINWTIKLFAVTALTIAVFAYFYTTNTQSYIEKDFVTRETKIHSEMASQHNKKFHSIAELNIRELYGLLLQLINLPNEARTTALSQRLSANENYFGLMLFNSSPTATTEILTAFSNQQREKHLHNRPITPLTQKVHGIVSEKASLFKQLLTNNKKYAFYDLETETQAPLLALTTRFQINRSSTEILSTLILWKDSFYADVNREPNDRPSRYSFIMSRDERLLIGDVGMDDKLARYIMRAIKSTNDKHSGLSPFQFQNEDLIIAGIYDESVDMFFVSASSGRQLLPIKTYLGKQGLYLAIIVIWLSAILVFLIANQHTQNLNNLFQSISAVARGNIEARSNLRSQDEVGQISRVFDEVANSWMDFTENTKQQIRAYETLLKGQRKAAEKQMQTLTHSPEIEQKSELEPVMITASQMPNMSSEGISTAHKEDVESLSTEQQEVGDFPQISIEVLPDQTPEPILSFTNQETKHDINEDGFIEIKLERHEDQTDGMSQSGTESLSGELDFEFGNVPDPETPNSASQSMKPQTSERKYGIKLPTKAS